MLLSGLMFFRRRMDGKVVINGSNSLEKEVECKGRCEQPRKVKSGTLKPSTDVARLKWMTLRCTCADNGSMRKYDEEKHQSGEHTSFK